MDTRLMMTDEIFAVASQEDSCEQKLLCRAVLLGRVAIDFNPSEDEPFGPLENVRTF